MAYAMMNPSDKEKPMTMLVIDQAVKVHDPRNETTYDGTIATIGGDYITVEYDGAARVFDKATQRIADDFGHIRFRTLDQVAADEAMASIHRTLKSHGLEITPGHDISKDNLRRIADLLLAQQDPEKQP